MTLFHNVVTFDDLLYYNIQYITGLISSSPYNSERFNEPNEDKLVILHTKLRLLIIQSHTPFYTTFRTKIGLFRAVRKKSYLAGFIETQYAEKLIEKCKEANFKFQVLDLKNDKVCTNWSDKKSIVISEQSDSEHEKIIWTPYEFDHSFRSTIWTGHLDDFDDYPNIVTLLNTQCACFSIINNDFTSDVAIEDVLLS